MAHTAYQKTELVLRDQLREAMLDHEAFEQKVRPCELASCRATCCYDGVYLSTEEAEGIELLLDQYAEFFADYGLTLPEQPIIAVRDGRCYKTATREAEPGELAEDFPAHFSRTRCVFLDRQGRCGIQRLSMQLGRSPWFDKPLTCWIHPIVISAVGAANSRSVVTLFSPENDAQESVNYPGFASCTHCGRPDDAGAVARDVLTSELNLLGKIGGRDLLGELNAEVV